MVNSVVARATNDLLIGPDWALNIEICDTLNTDPGQAKDVVKGLKKRIRSRNPKVQILALTLLEIVVKNCGDIVHMHVAEKDVVHEMVKIVKRKPDLCVKEKILSLVDTWQEAFGGSRARYPQYYAAYQELVRAGAVFPQRSERPGPMFTPPQTQPLTSSQNVHDPDNRQEADDSAEPTEYPTLSLTEIQSARSLMDVLAEMLNALDPGNEEGLRQEVIVDLVEQCRRYKQRVVHLVNTASDEDLLNQGLSLNDDLQRVLAKHEAIASGSSVVVERPKLLDALVDVNDQVFTTADNNTQTAGRSNSSVSAGSKLPVELLLPAPPVPNGPEKNSVKADLKIDLLSGEYYSSPTADDSLALVPVDEPQSSTLVSEHNALVLSDMFSHTSRTPDTLGPQSTYQAGQAYSSTQFQEQHPPHFPQATYNSNGGVSDNGFPQSEQSSFAPAPHLNHANQAPNSPLAQAWNHEQRQHAYGGVVQNSGTLPPPPWEARQMHNSQHGDVHYPQQIQMTQVMPTHSPPLQYSTPIQAIENNQTPGMYITPITNGQVMAMPNQSYSSNQQMGYHPHQNQGGKMMAMLPQPMNGGQLAPMHVQPMQSNQQMHLQPMHSNQQMHLHPMQSNQPLHLQPMHSNQQMHLHPMQSNQALHLQPMHSNQQMHLHPMQSNQPLHLQPMHSNQQMHLHPMQSNHPSHLQQMQSNQSINYTYGQRPESPFLEQRMHGLAMQDERATSMSYYGTANKPAAKSEDKLFGDLVDMTKFKPKN